MQKERYVQVTLSRHRATRTCMAAETHTLLYAQPCIKVHILKFKIILWHFPLITLHPIYPFFSARKVTWTLLGKKKHASLATVQYFTKEGSVKFICVGVRMRRWATFSVPNVSAYQALCAPSSLPTQRRAHECVRAPMCRGMCMRFVRACVQVHPLGIRIWLSHSVWGLTLSRHDRSK